MKFVEIFLELKKEVAQNKESIEKLKKEMAKIKKAVPSHKKTK